MAVLNPAAPFVVLVFEAESLCVAWDGPVLMVLLLFLIPRVQVWAPCSKLQSPLILMKPQEVRMMQMLVRASQQLQGASGS